MTQAHKPDATCIDHIVDKYANVAPHFKTICPFNSQKPFTVHSDVAFNSKCYTPKSLSRHGSWFPLRPNSSHIYNALSYFISPISITKDNSAFPCRTPDSKWNSFLACREMRNTRRAHYDAFGDHRAAAAYPANHRRQNVLEHGVS